MTRATSNRRSRAAPSRALSFADVVASFGVRAPFRRTLRELVLLAWPIAVAMGGETLMGLVDTKLVGHLGPAALGGVGVAMTVAFVGYMFCLGLMRGVKVNVAHAVGEGRASHGLRYAQAGMILGAASGGLFCLVMHDARPLLEAIGIDSALVPSAATFLTTFTLGAPAAAVVSALTHHRQATGDSRTPMIAGLSANLLNAALGWSLIGGHFGFPALGVRGAAAASVTAECFEACLLIALFVRELRRQRQGGDGVSRLPLMVAAREVATIGLPTGLQFGSESVGFAVFTTIIGSMGPPAIAAHQIALATLRMSFLPGVAVSEAASVLVGRALGRRSVAEADRSAHAAILVAVSFMTACGLVFAMAGYRIASCFTDDPEVLRVARQLLWIASLFQVLDAVSIVLRGALRGAKDVRVPALIGIAVMWTCVPTAASILGRGLAWGAAGGWCGFVAETTVSAALFFLRWRRGKWRQTYRGDADRTGPWTVQSWNFPSSLAPRSAQKRPRSNGSGIAAVAKPE